MGKSAPEAIDRLILAVNLIYFLLLRVLLPVSSSHLEAGRNIRVGFGACRAGGNVGVGFGFVRAEIAAQNRFGSRRLDIAKFSKKSYGNGKTQKIRT
jgi:hypothetical protein